MVFVWSQLTKGDAAYTLVQVTVNDMVMVVAFAPIAAFLLGVSNVAAPWSTRLVSVVLFVVVPLVAGMLTRRHLLQRGGLPALARLTASLQPWSIAGLLATVVLLFAFQAETLLAQPERVAMIAVPLVIQSYGIFALTHAAARWLRLEHAIAAPAALIGTSNFFELAVAVAIGLFGLSPGAALATVIRSVDRSAGDALARRHCQPHQELVRIPPRDGGDALQVSVPSTMSSWRTPPRSGGFLLLGR